MQRTQLIRGVAFFAAVLPTVPAPALACDLPDAGPAAVALRQDQKPGPGASAAPT